MCGDAFFGPEAIRLKHGCIRWVHIMGKLVPRFVELPFDDRDMQKWICFGCGIGNFILGDEGFRFSSRLKGLAKNGWCCLCRREIEPFPNPEWSSAVLVEIGTMVDVPGDDPDLVVKDAGHVHYLCLDDVHVELWRLIERSDTPDYKAWLRPCA